jgi:hypothetical protein
MYMSFDDSGIYAFHAVFTVVLMFIGFCALRKIL